MYDFWHFLEPKEQSVIERCPYYRGVCKERLECMYTNLQFKTAHQQWMLICWFLIQSKQTLKDWQHCDIEINIIQLETNKIPFQKTGKLVHTILLTVLVFQTFCRLQISSQIQKVEDSSPTFLNHLNNYNRWQFSEH